MSTADWSDTLLCLVACQQPIGPVSDTLLCLVACQLPIGPVSDTFVSAARAVNRRVNVSKLRSPSQTSPRKVDVHCARGNIPRLHRQVTSCRLSVTEHSTNWFSATVKNVQPHTDAGIQIICRQLLFCVIFWTLCRYSSLADSGHGVLVSYSGGIVV
jgi:hypothetical protein